MRSRVTVFIYFVSLFASTYANLNLSSYRMQRAAGPSMPRELRVDRLAKHLTSRENEQVGDNGGSLQGPVRGAGNEPGNDDNTHPDGIRNGIGDRPGSPNNGPDDLPGGPSNPVTSSSPGLGSSNSPSSSDDDPGRHVQSPSESSTLFPSTSSSERPSESAEPNGSAHLNLSSSDASTTLSRSITSADTASITSNPPVIPVTSVPSASDPGNSHTEATPATSSSVPAPRPSKTSDSPASNVGSKTSGLTDSTSTHTVPPSTSSVPATVSHTSSLPSPSDTTDRGGPDSTISKPISIASSVRGSSTSLQRTSGTSVLPVSSATSVASSASVTRSSNTGSISSTSLVSSASSVPPGLSASSTSHVNASSGLPVSPGTSATPASSTAIASSTGRSSPGSTASNSVSSSASAPSVSAPIFSGSGGSTTSTDVSQPLSSTSADAPSSSSASSTLTIIPDPTQSSHSTQSSSLPAQNSSSTGGSHSTSSTPASISLSISVGIPPISGTTTASGSTSLTIISTPSPTTTHSGTGNSSTIASTSSTASGPNSSSATSGISTTVGSSSTVAGGSSTATRGSSSTTGQSTSTADPSTSTNGGSSISTGDSNTTTVSATGAPTNTPAPTTTGSFTTTVSGNSTIVLSFPTSSLFPSTTSTDPLTSLSTVTQNASGEPVNSQFSYITASSLVTATLPSTSASVTQTDPDAPLNSTSVSSPTGASQTAAPTVPALPSSLPQRVFSPDSVNPDTDSQELQGMTLVSLLFTQAVNWNFLNSSKQTVAQVFAFMPVAIANGLGISTSDVKTYVLQVEIPQSWTGDVNDLGTMYLSYIPDDQVNVLASLIKAPNSKFFQQSGVPGQLAGLIVPSFSLLSVPAQAAADNSGSSSSSTMSKTRTDAIIGVCAAVGGVAALVAIWWIARYVQRKQATKHRRLSDLSDPNRGNGVYGTHNDDRRTSFFYAEDELRGGYWHSQSEGATGSAHPAQSSQPVAGNVMQQRNRPAVRFASISAPVLQQNSLNW